MNLVFKLCNQLFLFKNNQVSKFKFNPDIDYTSWSYLDFFRNKKNITYFQALFKTNSLKKILTKTEIIKLNNCNKKLLIHFNSIKESKIDINKINNLLEVLPKEILIEKYSVLNKVFKDQLAITPFSELELFNQKVYNIINRISKRKLKLVPSEENEKWLPFFKLSFKRNKTSRLSSEKGYFPLLNLKKEKRVVIEPRNDYFLELDLNGADLRAAIGLLGLEQPSEDAVSWLGSKIDSRGVSRRDLKTSLYSWLYNSSSTNDQLEQVLDRERILAQYWDGYEVTTVLGDKIKADKEHALSYLIQSVTHEIVFDRILAIDDILKNSQSEIAFFIHDSVIIDLAQEDYERIKELQEQFSKTILGTMKVNASISSQNYGTMKPC